MDSHFNFHNLFTLQTHEISNRGGGVDGEYPKRGSNKGTFCITKEQRLQKMQSLKNAANDVNQTSPGDTSPPPTSEMKTDVLLGRCGSTYNSTSLAFEFYKCEQGLCCNGQKCGLKSAYCAETCQPDFGDCYNYTAAPSQPTIIAAVVGAVAALLAIINTLVIIRADLIEYGYIKS